MDLVTIVSRSGSIKILESYDSTATLDSFWQWMTVCVCVCVCVCVRACVRSCVRVSAYLREEEIWDNISLIYVSYKI